MCGWLLMLIYDLFGNDTLTLKRQQPSQYGVEN